MGRMVGKLFGGHLGSSGHRAKCRSRGAALLLTIFLVAAIGVMLTVAGRVWRTEMQRNKETQLLDVGGEIARAITRYHAAAKQYPENLDQLLLDSRQQNTVRYLRRIYRDPLTGSKKWGLLKDVNGRITGVYSLGKGEPLKQAGFAKTRAQFKAAKSYADWTFVAETGVAVSAPFVPGAPGTSGGTPPGTMPAPVPPTQ